MNKNPLTEGDSLPIKMYLIIIKYDFIYVYNIIQNKVMGQELEVLMLHKFA